MLGFPGEESIRARAVDAQCEDHHCDCPCNEDADAECTCEQIAEDEAADAAEARLDAMEDRYW